MQQLKVTIEGPQGAGKSMLAHLLAVVLLEHGRFKHSRISIEDGGDIHLKTESSASHEIWVKTVQSESAPKGTVLLPWTENLTFMQQSVLIAAVRGPDGIRKDHPVKVLCRWLRRSMLKSAFTGEEIFEPYQTGGGSFTGPCKTDEVNDLDHAMELYFRSVDELPHHFQLHLMHAAEILGYKHPRQFQRKWWNKFYMACVKDMHLVYEDEHTMDYRLGDIEQQWRNSEVVIAKTIDSDAPHAPLITGQRYFFDAEKFGASGVYLSSDETNHFFIDILHNRHYTVNEMGICAMPRRGRYHLSKSY